MPEMAAALGGDHIEWVGVVGSVANLPLGHVGYEVGVEGGDEGNLSQYTMASSSR
jgi:hypothetical protein